MNVRETEVALMNGQNRETGNIWHKTQDTRQKHNTTLHSKDHVTFKVMIYVKYNYTVNAGSRVDYCDLFFP